MKIAVNSGALVAGQVFGMVSGLVSVAIAARYLGLDEYGQVIAAMVLVSMFSAAGDFGMSAVGARQLARDPTGEQRLARYIRCSAMAKACATPRRGLSTKVLSRISTAVRLTASSGPA